jgi:hypothetical protein
LALEAFNENFVRKKTKDGIDAFEKFESVKEEWAKKLAAWLEEDLGLEATVWVDLPGYSGPFDLTNSPRFVVHPKDTDDAVPLTYTIGVEPIPAANVPPAGKYLLKEHLDEKVQTRIGHHIQERVSLHELVSDEQSVKDRLRENLGGFLADYGLRIRFVKLQAEPTFGRNLLEGITYPVECIVDPNETKVTIRHALRLTWQDIGKLRRRIADGAQLEGWLKKILSDATRDELRDQTYAHLVVGFEACKRKIKAGVNKRLAEAGCHVQQLVTLNDLKHGKLVEHGFSLTEPKNPEIVAEYRTADSDVKFGLLVSVHGRFDLHNTWEMVGSGDEAGREQEPSPADVTDDARRKLLAIIKPEWDFEDAIRREIHACAQFILERQDPEDLFLHFAQYNPQSIGEPGSQEHTPRIAHRPPQALLEDGIAARLREKFGAQCEVTATYVDTQIGRLFRALIEFPQQEVPIEVHPHDSPQERLPCRLNYLVRGIARGGWRTFQNRCRGPLAQDVINQITSSILSRAGRDLKVLRSDELFYATAKQVAGIEKMLHGTTGRAVGEDFGLAIAIMFDRDKTEDENAISQTRIKARSTWVKEQIARIENTSARIEMLRGRMVHPDLQTEEREEMQEELKLLEKDLRGATGDLEAARGPSEPTRRGSSLAEFEELAEQERARRAPAGEALREEQREKIKETSETHPPEVSP